MEKVDMNQSQSPAELLEFPCEYTFKAVGLCGEEFRQQVENAVAACTLVSRDAVYVRESRNGTYQSVSVMVRLHSSQQLFDIYARLKTVSGLKMLL
jgi:putative lipoic acid-binding regulatory protein